MEVTLKIRTIKGPAQVYITGAMNFSTVNGLDEFMATVKIAREWLKKQPRSASQLLPKDMP